MASIFTYDPDPPRVSSPWLASVKRDPKRTIPSLFAGIEPEQANLDMDDLYAALPDDHGVTRLEAEPQEGPTEYKLHLLLRPRKSMSSSSTPLRSGNGSPALRLTAENLNSSSPPLASSNTPRQHRLEQLTTQLLWRLQQSSPYHSSAATNLVLPTLPQATTELQVPRKPAKLLPGLEESKGALYEIGVADDGSFVGLTQDEMEESLTNLRAMAASLGCSVDVLRMVQVGECDWMEHESSRIFNHIRSRSVKLYVAEAYVKPEFTTSDDTALFEDKAPTIAALAAAEVDGAADTALAKQQLRVSLTGATTSGKSSLLGTLSTSTLDNGRGKSRLSLLKHRHEIASGMTSSVAQELIGYRDKETEESMLPPCRVINYATGNVSSWTDIHASSESGRLALLSDSAGHPRYRRTTVRGLVGWAPHWTILCIAANSNLDEATKTQNVEQGLFAGAAAHLSMAHLDICLRLEIPLIIAITKFDAATKTAFRQLLSTILTLLKSSGRNPLMLATNPQEVSEDDLQTISPLDFFEISKAVDILNKDAFINIPILFTSAVKGTGIGKLHALLRQLPVSSPSSMANPGMRRNLEGEQPDTLFHVDDFYKLRIRDMSINADTALPSNQGTVLSGHLSRGVITVGDELVLGPFAPNPTLEIQDADPHIGDNSKDSFLSPRSFNDALFRATASPKLKVSVTEHEWVRVTVISIRNLKLPVKRLERDQAGTIGVVPLASTPRSDPLAIRKGMVICNYAPTASHTFTASFDVDDAGSAVVGSLVLVYCATIRASAKVIAVALNNDTDGRDYENWRQDGEDGSEDGFRFELDETAATETSLTSHESISISFQFVRCREYMEVGSKVLVMPGGGPSIGIQNERGVKGVGGLEGFVGLVLETFG